MLLLMDQNNDLEIRNNDSGCIEPCKNWDKLPTSTGFNAGFLNHQQLKLRGLDVKLSLCGQPSTVPFDLDSVFHMSILGQNSTGVSLYKLESTNWGWKNPNRYPKLWDVYIPIPSIKVWPCLFSKLILHQGPNMAHFQLANLGPKSSKFKFDSNSIQRTSTNIITCFFWQFRLEALFFLRPANKADLFFVGVCLSHTLKRFY